jgi:hypothetical protein
LEYAESLPRLKILRLRREYTIIGPDETYHLPLVEKVTIRSPESRLALVKCPNAVDLTLILGSYYGITFNLPQGNWHNLRALTIETEGLHSWEDISLPQVERIQVTENWPGLLHDLAQYPDIFPALKCIWMKHFPDWDILFLMLERRNFHRDIYKSVSRIEAIKLPFAPARMILEPLSALLRGHVSSRPSNFELSFDFIAPIFFDPEM